MKKTALIFLLVVLALIQILVCRNASLYYSAKDIDEDPADGCEYDCDFVQADELCNLDDDDCDGLTDENDPEGGGACYTAATGCSGDPLTCEGICAPGTEHCVLGNLECSGQTPPALTEECNDLDDDCDVDLDDYVFLEICLSLSGPGGDPGFQDCVDVFDFDYDADVDVADFGGFQNAFPH